MFTIEHDFDATVITLVLVPAFYLVLEDFLNGCKKVIGALKRLYVGADSAEPAETAAAPQAD